MQWLNMTNKKGASKAITGGFLLVIIIGLFIFGPALLKMVGVSVVPSPTSLNNTMALGVISINSPAKVSPSSAFGVTFLIANNVNYKASNIYFCLDNLGLFTILSSPQVSSPVPGGNAITSGRCVNIPSLTTGGIISEGFTLSVPPASAYGNIQYSQNIGYYLNFSYKGGASQQLEFVSQSASSSGSYQPPITQAVGVTNGPISISSSSSQPVIYGQDIELTLNLNNVGLGAPIGNVKLLVYLNSSTLNVTDAGALGFSVTSFNNGTEILSKEVSIGPAGASITLPVGLSPSESSRLSASNLPDSIHNLKFKISYSYEQEGYFPIGLYISPYSI